MSKSYNRFANDFGDGDGSIATLEAQIEQTIRNNTEIDETEREALSKFEEDRVISAPNLSKSRKPVALRL